MVGVSDRLAVTNQALRDLSGCNGLLVRDWIERHKDEVISHNAKYGMENKKDPSNPASYANKGKDTDKILLLINEEFLNGEGLRQGEIKVVCTSGGAIAPLPAPFSHHDCVQLMYK